MDLKAQGELMEHAQAFVNSTSEHLKGRLGRAPTEEEMLIFCSAVGSMNSSFCYAKVYESGGREPADTWMQQIFLQIGMAVQGRGIPVTLKIDLKSIPMEGDASERGSIDQGTPPIIICKCITDSTGQCPSCLKELCESLTKAVEVTATLQQFQNKERCAPCVQKLFDAAFAKVITEKFATVNQTVRDMITTMAVQMGSANGVTDIPQIEAALAAAKTKQGAGA